MLCINFKQGFLESKDSASQLNCAGDRKLQTKRWDFFPVGFEELFCFAFVRVSMETPLLEMCHFFRALIANASKRQTEAVMYFSATISW